MNLQQLRYLAEVADGPSLSAAARRLGISQPVLSRAIRALERDLGADLVVLDGRRLRVLPESAPVVEAAREAIAAFDRVGTVAARLHAREVTVAASPSHQTLLAPLLPELVRRAGRTVRLLSADDTEDMARLIRAGRADLGFGEAVSHLPDLEVRPLGMLELVYVAAAGTDLPDVVDLGEQSPLQVALLDNPERMEILDKLLADAGGSVERVFEAGDRIVLLKAVESGLAPTVATRALIEHNPLLDHRPFRPAIGYPVVAVLDPARLPPGAAEVLETLADVDWR
jgi:DNA-binding transcriptional LysR family regulator